MKIRFCNLIVIVLFIYVSSAFSQEEQLLLELLSDAREDKGTGILKKELAWLQAEISSITEIATKTKTDSDLAPGIVSLLYGDDLKKQGVRNVLEALTLVPGLDVIRGGDGAIQIIVRGIGRAFASGKIRIMLNHTLLNSTMSGEPDAAIYLMPIEQVRRIEIIRGPGAALYGKWAYAGVINVITRQEKNSVFARYGRFNERSVGGVFSFSNSESPLKASLNITGWEKDRTDMEAGNDMLYGIEYQNISNAPGSVNDASRLFSAILMLDYKALFLRAQYSTSSWGSLFGMADALPPLNEEYTQTVNSHFLEGGYQSDISDALNLKILFGWREYILDMDDFYVFPAGFDGYEDGMVMDPYYKGDSLYGGLDFRWSGWKNHLLLTGMEYEKAEISDAWHDANYAPLTFEPLDSVQRFKENNSWLDPGTNRVIWSFFAQDQFALTDSLTLTLGVRYDDYDDTDNKFTPRLAGVFQASEHHIFKAQYSEGFRPPTFMEMYSKNNPVISGNTNISPETVRTSELGYIFKTIPFTVRGTLFHSELRDLISYLDGKYANIADARSSGAEFEAKWRILRFLMLDANLSYMDTEDKATGGEIEGAVRWLGNAGVSYQPIDNLFFSFRYQYVGKRSRSPDDSRYKLKCYNTFNMSAGIQNLLLKGFSCNMGIRNVFNEDIRYPSTLGGYESDYPQTGREWWIRLSYDF